MQSLSRLRIIRAKMAVACVLTCCIGVILALAGPVSSGKYLYTKTDPSATGGIQGTIVGPHKNILGVFALPPSEPKSVYKGDLGGENNRDFYFKGLPADRYDLVVLLDGACYEGITLSRRENTLSKEDHRKIDASIQKSEAFFDKKIVHRMAGTTGRGNMARCFVEYLRTRKMLDINDSVYTDHRRSIKLTILKDVGPGWQIARSREIDVRFFKPGGTMKHSYAKELSRIRVIDEVKDIGQVRLR